MKACLQNPKSEWRSPKEVRRPHAVVRRSGFGVRYSFVIFYSAIAFCPALFGLMKGQKIVKGQTLHPASPMKVKLSSL